MSKALLHTIAAAVTIGGVLACWWALIQFVKACA